jgi:hypothetical protein
MYRPYITQVQNAQLSGVSVPTVRYTTAEDSAKARYVHTSTERSFNAYARSEISLISLSHIAYHNSSEFVKHRHLCVRGETQIGRLETKPALRIKPGVAHDHTEQYTSPDYIV